MIYLDHASTSLPRHPLALEAAMEGASWSTPGRGDHGSMIDATLRVEHARQAVAHLIAGVRPAVVCFTAGATASLNQAIVGLCRNVRLIAIDPLLHNAAYRPAVRRCARSSASTTTTTTLWRLPSLPNGCIDLTRARREWKTQTDLVVLTHASNVTGTVQPVAEMTALAHEHGATVVVDCAQTVGLLDPLELGDADIVAFSAHKALRALPGVGALVVRGGDDAATIGGSSSMAVAMEPLVVGGTGGSSLSPEMPEELPSRVEAGTPNLPGIAAMCAMALRAAKHKHKHSEVKACALGLREAVLRADIVPMGGEDLPIVSFVLPGIDPEAVAELLDRAFAIACRAGLHCAPVAHDTLGSKEHGGTVRLSASITTTNADLETLTLALKATKRLKPP